MSERLSGEQKLSPVPGLYSDSSSDSGSSVKGPDTGESNTLIGTASTTKGMNDLANDTSTMSLDKLEDGARFTPQYPSAVPTPLYKRFTDGDIDDHRSKEGDKTNAFDHDDPRVPMAPPTDLLTHFGVVNEHLRVSTMYTQQQMHSTGQEIVSAMQAQHRNTILIVNNNMENVYKSMNQVEEKITALVDKVTETSTKSELNADNVASLKTDVNSNVKDIKGNINNIGHSIQGLVATSDKVLTLNRTMSKKILELVQRVQQLETSQGTIITFLSNRHANFPSVDAPPLQPSTQSGECATAYNGHTAECNEEATQASIAKRQVGQDANRRGAPKSSMKGIPMNNGSESQRMHFEHLTARMNQGHNGGRTQSYNHAQPQGHSSHWSSPYVTQGHQSAHDPFQTQSVSPANPLPRGMPPAAEHYGWVPGWDISQVDPMAYYSGHPALNGYSGLDSFNGVMPNVQGVALPSGKQEKSGVENDENQGQKDGL
jgi:hypothetical protein